MTTRHFHTLDSMRGVAAVAVVCMHMSAFLAPIAVPHGYLAVDLFFGLSGLVIAHAYGARLDAGIGFGRFALLRLVRLYPLYLAGTLIGIVFYLAATRMGQRDGHSALEIGSSIAAALVMLPAPFVIGPRDWLQPFNIVGWSLFFELAVNLLLVVIWRWLTRGVLIAIILVSGIVLAVQTGAHGTADVGAEWSTAALGIARTLFSFFLGVALQRLPRPPVMRTSWAWLLPAALVLTFLPSLMAGPYYDLVCIMILFPAFIYAGTIVEPHRGGVAEMLGAISFAIYALHSPLMPVANTMAKQVIGRLEPIAPWSGMALVILMIGIAWAADLFYDRPVRRRLAMWLRTPRSAAA
ncbi:MAG TPA: acyltransferase [Sphingomonas sp.]|jgi:peptidoglycan/LPS O-acetylase OafA/YrhL|uniref:acyltransferase family protein n=1 Tax=Sphingomonas sp. TaxID=28214 RepID=UPI002ED8F0B5